MLIQCCPTTRPPPFPQPPPPLPSTPPTHLHCLILEQLFHSANPRVAGWTGRAQSLPAPLSCVKAELRGSSSSSRKLRSRGTRVNRLEQIVLEPPGFRGHVLIPVTSCPSFYLHSSPGSRFFLDGKNVQHPPPHPSPPLASLELKLTEIQVIFWS